MVRARDNWSNKKQVTSHSHVFVLSLSLSVHQITFRTFPCNFHALKFPMFLSSTFKCYERINSKTMQKNGKAKLHAFTSSRQLLRDPTWFVSKRFPPVFFLSQKAHTHKKKVKRLQKKQLLL